MREVQFELGAFSVCCLCMAFLPSAGFGSDCPSIFAQLVDTRNYSHEALLIARDKLEQVQVSAGSSERLANAKRLSVSSKKFTQASDEQLSQQWRGHELVLRLPKDFNHEFFTPLPGGQEAQRAKILRLRKGDHLVLRRIVHLRAEELEELLQTRLVTSHLYSALNFDRKDLIHFVRHHAMTPEHALDLAWGGGFFGVSTAYAGISGRTRGGNAPKVERSWERGRFAVTLQFVVPAEALVQTVEGNHGYGLPKLPPHVRANPVGFGFVRESSGESEVTFTDFIPRQWVDPAWIAGVEKEYQRLKEANH